MTTPISPPEGQDKTGFTPGPWYLDGGFVYSERNRETVRAAKAKDRNCGDGNIPLAKVIADFAGEQQANARLIAAAPALYEALSEMVRLSQMGLEESLREPEENGNYAAFNRAVAALNQVRAIL